MASDAHLHRRISCVRDARAAAPIPGEVVWIDLDDPSDADLEEVGKNFSIHPLTIEDLQKFSQRAKAEEFDDYIYLVVFGAADETDEDRVVEVHLLVGHDFVITVSRDRSLELAKLHDNTDGRDDSVVGLLHAILDRLIDSWGPLLDELDSDIEALESRIAESQLKGVELELHDLRSLVGRINRLIHRESEVLTRLPALLRRLFGADGEELPYFRDVLDHLLRLGESTDAMRDRIVGTFELYMAAINNRQNLTMKQFTVIAGIFLPLSVVTGFFGMNFAWMVEHVDSGLSFLLLGVLLPVAIAAGLMALFFARGLFRE